MRAAGLRRPARPLILGQDGGRAARPYPGCANSFSCQPPSLPREPPGAQRPLGRRASGCGRVRPPAGGGLKTYRKFSRGSPGGVLMHVTPVDSESAERIPASFLQVVDDPL